MEIKYIYLKIQWKSNILKFCRKIVGVLFVWVVGKLWTSTGAFWKMVLENLIPMVEDIVFRFIIEYIVA
jgi:hypothetical protein